MSFLQFKESSFIGTRYVHICNLKVKTLGWVEVRAVFRSGDIDSGIVIQCANLMMSQLR